MNSMLKRIFVSTAALATLGLVMGCGEQETVGTADAQHDVRRQAVTVVPEFVITGAEAIPSSLFVTELGLTVSEIRLEPMWSTESLADATREPLAVSFDLAHGESVRTNDALQLPAAGRYLVSIRLEPATTADGAAESSFSLDGFVAERQGQLLDDTMDGRPQPMPFDQTQKSDSEITDAAAYPAEWTPFEYRSKRAVFFTFNDVTLEPGSQFLTFSFDVRDWAVDVVEPISNAVKSSAEWDESVDVTNQIDSTGNGVEALVRTGVVRSDRRP